MRVVEIRTCNDCPNRTMQCGSSFWYCRKTQKMLLDCHHDVDFIPDWCPLPKAEEVTK
jgi:hypothetical protein